MAFNKKRTTIGTPAGNSAKATGTGSATSSVIEKVQTHFSFGVDAGNAVPATSLVGDPFSVSRTGVGEYTVKLGGATALAGGYGVKKVITAFAKLQKSAASVLEAEVGAITPSTGTIVIRTVNRSTGAAANPAAAGDNERIHVEVTFDNGAN
jgi:hypothetical protein